MNLSNMRNVNGTKEIAYGFITSRRVADKMTSPELNKSTETTVEALSVQTAQRSEGVGLKDISMSFNTNESYGYIGKDKDVAALDVQKAISDMQKDHILHQYQYFVGNKPN